MNIIRVMRNVDVRKLLKVLVLGLKHPLFVVPTFFATKKCLSISTELYGRAHYQNGPANAFRHALWNYLIAKKCFKWGSNPSKVLSWAKQITDWHEDAFPNRTLARVMDLHNNAVGRFLFSKYRNESLEKVIRKLSELTKTSMQIRNESDIMGSEMQLVHIINTP